MSNDLEKKEETLSVIRNTDKITPYDGDIKQNKIFKTNCKFCNSPYRAEAEARFDNIRMSGVPNYREIHRFLLEKGEDLTYPACRSHLVHHHMSDEQAVALSEFGNKVGEWRDLQDDKYASLTRRICIVENEMSTIAALSQGLPLEERRKNAETVGKLASILLAHEEKLKDFNKDKEPAVFIMNQLQIIIQEEIKQSSEDTKKVLFSILNQLQYKANRKGYMVKQGE